MATDHMDGFDHRGTGATGRTNMLNGIYSEITSGWAPTTDNPRTGVNAMFMTTLAVTRCVVRRFFKVLGAKKFLGHAWFLPALPDLSFRFCVCQFLTAANVPIVSFTISTTGAMQVMSGDVAPSDNDGTLLGEGNNGDFVPGIYQHIECMAHVNGASSSAEVRVNGVVAVSLSGINLGSTPIGQWVIGRPRTNSDGVNNCSADDQRAGDDVGAANNDFIGDRRVITDMPNADGATQQWTPNSGANAFSRVDEIPPNDDTDYVESDAVDELCQLSFPNLPAGVASVDCVAFEAYGKKTDVGVAGLSVNVKSGATVGPGAEEALNLAYEYLPIQCFDEDPAAAGPWTPTTTNAALCELDHSS